MNQGKYVFSQLFELVSHNDFLKCVNKYNGDYKTKHFSCWKQFLCMAFGQLTHRESLSDTILCIQANSTKLYHLGIGKAITKSTLSKANENRDWRIYQDFALLLIRQAKELYGDDNQLEVEIKNNVFAIDSTTVDLCLSLFPWAKFRKHKAAVKLHTMLDLKTSIPEFVFISDGKMHDVNILDLITILPDSFYVMDRGFLDFFRLYRIHRATAFFIIRAKKNLKFIRLYSSGVDKTKGVMCDQTIKLSGFYVSKDYPEKIRRIKFYDLQTDKTFVFLTNNFELSALEIALLYKHRWFIEIFFKWIKQHLKIKSFWGNSQNAVKIQIWIAISVYVIVLIMKKKLRLTQSIYEILQILSINIFDKDPLYQLFNKADLQDFKEQNYNQLKLF
ncbi:MAG: IS4 family transposase [Prolixibacteraceae bacterium]|nr:IS4 family transposase [Prolixibacteraceae bacterium]